ncbi:GerAB/ArcD/ProY family transporter [Peribacillus sp. SCS-26]|uniref:GerAB/ArcD/ProY family transporter n=1 Tax=Paraperibacillus marinus TaxID=3115295 RepID=UPI003906ADD4
MNSPIQREKMGFIESMFFIIHAQIGVGVLSMPYTIFLQAGEDAWISVLISGLVVQLMLILYHLLCKRFPGKNIFEISVTVLGPIGWLAGAVYTLYFFLVSTNMLALFGNVINKWLLPLTPVWLVILLMVVVGTYAVHSPLIILAKFMLVSSFVFLIFILLISTSFLDADIYNILPIGSKGVFSILKGVKEAAFSMIGFELFLVIYPYIRGSGRSKLKSAMLANAFVIFFYTLAVLATLMFFSEMEIAIIPEPLLYIIKSYSFQVVERIDILFLSLWMVAVGTTYMGYLFGTAKGLSHMFKKKDHLSCVIPAAASTYIFSLIPHGEYDVTATSHFISLGSSLATIIIPVILFVAAFLRRRES